MDDAEFTLQDMKDHAAACRALDQVMRMRTECEALCNLLAHVRGFDEGRFGLREMDQYIRRFGDWMLGLQEALMMADWEVLKDDPTDRLERGPTMHGSEDIPRDERWARGCTMSR